MYSKDRNKNNSMKFQFSASPVANSPSSQQMQGSAAWNVFSPREPSGSKHIGRGQTWTFPNNFSAYKMGLERSIAFRVYSCLVYLGLCCCLFSCLVLFELQHRHRGPAAIVFISRDTCSDSIAKWFCACFNGGGGASHDYRAICCKIGYRTDMPVWN